MDRRNAGLVSALRTEKKGTPARPKRQGLDRRSVAMLGEVPLFAGLSRRHIQRLAGLADEVRFGAGRSVVQNGSKGMAFFVILQGEAKVTVGYSNRALARIGPGGYFGELALLDGGPRTASVIAETPLVLAKISRAGFIKLLKDDPDVAIRILVELSRRLRRERSATD